MSGKIEADTELEDNSLVVTEEDCLRVVSSNSRFKVDRFGMLGLVSSSPEWHIIMNVNCVPSILVEYASNVDMEGIEVDPEGREMECVVDNSVGSIDEGYETLEDDLQ